MDGDLEFNMVSITSSESPPRGPDPEFLCLRASGELPLLPETGGPYSQESVESCLGGKSGQQSQT